MLPGLPSPATSFFALFQNSPAPLRRLAGDRVGTGSHCCLARGVRVKRLAASLGSPRRRGLPKVPYTMRVYLRS
jgi:hypothetical protein